MDAEHYETEVSAVGPHAVDVDVTPLPEDLRNVAWSRYLGRLVEGLDVRPIVSERFGGKTRVDQAGMSRMFEVQGGPQLVLRRPPKGRSVFNEFAMLVQVEGSCEVKRGRRTTVTRPGETLLVGGNHDVDLGYDADFKQVVIQLPRALVFRQYEWLRDMDGVVLSAEDPAGQLLRYSLTGLAAVIRQLTPEQRLHAVSGLMAQLGVIGPERTPAAAPELFDRALALIKTHLSDPDVSPERLAGALQVKRRTLDAAFAGRGESVMKTVWDQRLDRAAELLAGGTTRSVTDVALALGFSSLPHFSRVFKKRFGVSPSRYARPMR